MSRPSLLKSVSVQELKEMHENGMTRMQIAKHLDVSYHTICKYLPKEYTPYGSNQTAAKDVVKPVEKPVEKKPLLKLISCTAEYEGQFMRYVVSHDTSVVAFVLKDETDELFELNKSQLEGYISELIDLLGLFPKEQGGVR